MDFKHILRKIFWGTILVETNSQKRFTSKKGHFILKLFVLLLISV